jgi:hypothetical protein
VIEYYDLTIDGYTTRVKVVRGYVIDTIVTRITGKPIEWLVNYARVQGWKLQKV